ncbi:transposase [Lelliottia sp. RWM.1]|uniref:transposase n=1 Tax=Lelliottia sp. RWM.1 TaxID=2663242 RepID=UPI0035C7ADD4
MVNKSSRKSLISINDFLNLTQGTISRLLNLMKNTVDEMTEITQATPPDICPRCGSTGTVTVISKTIGGVVRYYFKCSSCNYQWPVQ